MRVQHPGRRGRQHTRNPRAECGPTGQRREHEQQPPQHQGEHHAYRRHPGHVLLIRKRPELFAVGVQERHGDGGNDAQNRHDCFDAQRRLRGHYADGPAHAERTQCSYDGRGGDRRDAVADLCCADGDHEGRRYQGTSPPELIMSGEIMDYSYGPMSQVLMRVK